MWEEENERKKMEGAFVGIKRVKDQSHMPKQGWCFLPPEPHISYHFTLACGPKRPAPWEPGSLLIFPVLHLSGGCLKCSAWDSLHPQMCFMGATLWGGHQSEAKSQAWPVGQFSTPGHCPASHQGFFGVWRPPAQKLQTCWSVSKQQGNPHSLMQGLDSFSARGETIT